MRYNGTICYEILDENAAKAVDSNGEPISATSSWSEPVPCFITENSDTKLGKYEDGEFRQASFTILIEGHEWPQSARRVRLTRYTETLGEYRVMQSPPIATFERVSIIV